MNRGGKREGAGRPTKVDEHKANVIFLNALKNSLQQRYRTTSKKRNL